MKGSLRSWLGRKTEYFECAQFDGVAQAVGVSLAEKNRFCMKSRVLKASTNMKTRTIRFNKKWILSLSPKARCAVFVHEIWHIATVKKKIRARNWYLAYIFLGLSLLSFGFVAVVYAATFLVGQAVFLPGLPVLTWPVSVLVGMPYGFRRFSWPIEYECDEASVRFIGVDATKEFLKTLKLNTDKTTHPPTKLRLANVDKVAPKYPNPVIEFDALERLVKQEFVFS